MGRRLYLQAGDFVTTGLLTTGLITVLTTWVTYTRPNREAIRRHIKPKHEYFASPMGLQVGLRDLRCPKEDV